MASSNRHWPSMFKSKPCNATRHHLQWQPHDLTPGYHRTPGCEERSLEPKPRWNPRPEQIRILEAIFNSGMVNPPRDEIRKIRAQLQEYGQVGDANVFYWFQNRKSRSKHKQRQLHNASKSHNPPAPASSSSSSDKTNSTSEKALSTPVIDLLNSPTAPRDQLLTQHLFFPVQHNIIGGSSGLTQGFCFPDLDQSHHSIENCPSFSLSELMLMNNNHSVLNKAHDEKIRLQQEMLTAGPSIFTPSSLAITSPTDCILQDVGEMVPTKSTVFINDVCLEVGSGPFNVREAFGDDAVLVQSSGQPVITDEWGITEQPLHHGHFYYLLRPFNPSLDHNKSIRLI